MSHGEVYEKRCINDYNLSIKIEYHKNGYGWIPLFYSELLCNMYKEYNPEYYIYIINLDDVMEYLDIFLFLFLNRYKKLLVFT